jgi:hypothetical protein
MQSTSVCDKLCATLLAYHGSTPPSAPLDGAKIMLFSNSVAFHKALQESDLTECVFSGYAESAAITFNAPVQEQDGTYSVSSPSKQMQATTATPFVGDTIVGVALIDGATPPNLLYVGTLDTPLTITAADQGLDVIVTVNQGGLSVNTEITVVS